MNTTAVRVCVACLVLAGACCLAWPSTLAAAPSAAPSVQAERQPQESQAAKGAEQGPEEHGDGWMAVIAKAVNFALLVGVLVYFLKSPLLGYLDSRITAVREDLVTAAQTREAASRQLAGIEAKLRELPAELDTLKGQGAEEIAAERVRIEQAAEHERQRLLDHARREVEMRLRIARRDLVEHAATLAVQVAKTRIERSITPDDQARLLDRYTSQLGARP